MGFIAVDIIQVLSQITKCNIQMATSANRHHPKFLFDVAPSQSYEIPS
jgi:hypothetical protein